MTPAPPTIDGARLIHRLTALREIGATASGGVTREAFGDRDVEARRLVQSWMDDAGLATAVDAAANLVGRSRGNGRWIATGSHLDTVVDGGWLDGAYGVVAGVEVAAALVAAGVLEHGLLVAAFGNEEGARGTDGMTGSRAVVGPIDPAELARVDDEGVTVAERLAVAGGDPGALDGATWDLPAIDAFLELHIEQGPVLHAVGDVLGVVPAITGRQSVDIRVGGRANHAGTTPMHLRRDGLAAAAEVVLAVESLPERSGTRVATCGHITARPNVRNVVPGVVLLSAEIRDEDSARLAAAMEVLADDVGRIAEARSIEIELHWGQRVEPTLCAETVVAAVKSAVAASGLGWSTLPSGAGHDAQILGQVVPTGMIFVPSIDGLSHTPAEDSRPDDLIAGAQALLDSILVLDREAP